MIAYRSSNIDSYLQQIRLAIQNGQSPDIAAALAVYGYDAAKTGAGVPLLATVEELQAVQKKEYSEQYAATTALGEAWKAADKIYATHRKLAKLALRNDPDGQKALMLHEPKAQTLDPWLGQAGVFYKNLLESDDMLAAMAVYNITDLMLIATRDAVVQVAAFNGDQEREKSEARKATRARDAALDALDDWYNEFRALARIALEDDPQRLEALGLSTVA